MFDADIETVEFDFRSEQTWGPVFEDARGLLVLRPPAISSVESDIHPAIDAAVEAGSEHVVVLSVMEAGDNPSLPHRRIEKHVESLDVAYTHVRPGVYMQNVSGVHRPGIRLHDEVIVPAGRGRANFVDTRDVGEVAAVALAEGASSHHGAIYEPTGPVALGYHDVAAVLSDVLDRPITYDEPGLIRYVSHMRRDTDHDLGFILFSCLLHTLVRLGCSERLTDDVRKVTGHPPRTFREFAQDYADAWR